jgi:hypothetical protein
MYTGERAETPGQFAKATGMDLTPPEQSELARMSVPHV